MELNGKHYHGTIAENYDADRMGARWNAEQAHVRKFLSTHRGAAVLDVPVGTGRFTPYYSEFQQSCLGLDISDAMLIQAEQRLAHAGVEFDLRYGSILEIPLDAKCMDLAVCTRLLNWLDRGGVKQALAELSRVVCDSILVEIRLSDVHSTTPPAGMPTTLHSEIDFASFKFDAGLYEHDRVVLEDKPWSQLLMCELKHG